MAFARTNITTPNSCDRQNVVRYKMDQKKVFTEFAVYFLCCELVILWRTVSAVNYVNKYGVEDFQYIY